MGLNALSDDFRALRIAPLATPDSRTPETCTAGCPSLSELPGSGYQPHLLVLVCSPLLLVFVHRCGYSYVFTGFHFWSCSAVISVDSVSCRLREHYFWWPHRILWPCVPLVRHRSHCLPACLAAVEQALANSVRSWLLVPFPYGDGWLLEKFPGERLVGQRGVNFLLAFGTKEALLLSRAGEAVGDALAAGEGPVQHGPMGFGFYCFSCS